jgi:DNA polymerase-3 subunit delta'
MTQQSGQDGTDGVILMSVGEMYPWLKPAWNAFTNELDSGRLAHAILLSGPKDSGKQDLALLMVAQLLCAIIVSAVS